MTQAGEIFLYKDFPFEDGSKTDKLFVVLNSFDLSIPCVALKTTSQPRRYQGVSKGCNKERKCFYAPKDWQTCFILNTYIVLPNLYEFDVTELLQGKFSGNVEFLKSSLTSDCLGQLKACLAGYKDDISPMHWALIYKAKS